MYPTILIRDKQNGGKEFAVERKLAYKYLTVYPQRFEAVDAGVQASPETLTNGVIEMPTGIPKGFEPLSDGVHTLKIVSVETKLDGFKKNQEVAACVADGNEEGPKYNLYFPHESKKWFDQGLAAGVIFVDGENWRVLVGVKCKVLVQNGKIVTVFKD